MGREQGHRQGIDARTRSGLGWPDESLYNEGATLDSGALVTTSRAAADSSDRPDR